MTISAPSPPDLAPTVSRVEGRRRDRARRGRRDLAIFGGALAAALAISVVTGEVNLAKFVEGFPRLFSYLGRTLPHIEVGALAEGLTDWFWRWPVWSARLFDTLVIAFLATVFAGTFAFGAAFLAARNLVPRPVSETVRRILEFLRTVPELVFALIFVFAFGIGPFAGFLAVFIHTVGTLGKLFAETVENADDKGVEALEAMGADWVARMRFGIVPQVLPSFVSYTLLAFENNVRAASVLGFVGAGGIGQEVMSAIKQFQYTDVSALVVMIAAVVIAIDIASGRLRRRLVEG